jgi:hypothetical protein
LKKKSSKIWIFKNSVLSLGQLNWLVNTKSANAGNQKQVTEVIADGFIMLDKPIDKAECRPAEINASFNP